MLKDYSNQHMVYDLGALSSTAPLSTNSRQRGCNISKRGCLIDLRKKIKYKSDYFVYVAFLLRGKLR